MMFWLFLMILVVLVVGGAIVAGLVTVFVALLGAGSLLGFAVSRKKATVERPTDSLWSFLWVSALGVVLAALFCAGVVDLDLEAMTRLASNGPPAAGAETWVTGTILAFIPVLGGAVAGWLHVALRDRPRRWILGWALALSVPLYGMLAVLGLSGEWLVNHLPKIGMAGG